MKICDEMKNELEVVMKEISELFVILVVGDGKSWGI